MDDVVQWLIFGVPIGCVYALVAIGLVLTYKTSGVFNLAFSAQAFVSGAVFYQMVARDEHPLWLGLRRRGAHRRPADRADPRPLPVPLHAHRVVAGEARHVARPPARDARDRPRVLRLRERRRPAERRGDARDGAERGRLVVLEAPRVRPVARRLQHRRLLHLRRPDGHGRRDAARSAPPRAALPLHRARPADACRRREPADGRARGRRLRAGEHDRLDALEPARRARRRAARAALLHARPEHLHAADHRGDRRRRGRTVHEHPDDPRRRPAHRDRRARAPRHLRHDERVRRRPAPVVPVPRAVPAARLLAEAPRAARGDRPARGRRPATAGDGARVQGRSAPASSRGSRSPCS